MCRSLSFERYLTLHKSFYRKNVTYLWSAQNGRLSYFSSTVVVSSLLVGNDADSTSSSRIWELRMSRVQLRGTDLVRWYRSVLVGSRSPLSRCWCWSELWAESEKEIIYFISDFRGDKLFRTSKKSRNCEMKVCTNIQVLVLPTPQRSSEKQFF